MNPFQNTIAIIAKKEFRKTENIHFLATSNIVPSVPLGKSIASNLQELEDGKIMYNAHADKDIFVKCPVMAVLADNPRSSEFEHHLGSCANKFCRKCNATYENGTEIQEIRTDDHIREKVQEIQACISESRKREKRKEYGITEKGGAFDILKCFSGNNKTPIEILHTILLGSGKYLLANTIQSSSQQQKDQLHAKIQSIDMCSFASKITRNITRNYGSYVGRDFKLWVQVAVFVLKDIIPDEELLLWELLSEIFTLSYATGFDKRNLDAAKQLLKSFVSAVSQTYPELLRKAKIHLMLHLVDDIENLGPANGFCTERFEAFNSIIRGMNVNSNRHASSLDICNKLAMMEKLRFVLGGGKWGENHCLQASRNILNLAADPKLEQFLNNISKRESMDGKEIYQPGCLRKGTYKKGKLQTEPLHQALEQDTIEGAGLVESREETCISYRAVVSETQALINVETPVVYVDNQHEHHLGIFKKGLKIESENREIVAIEQVKFCKDDFNQSILGSFQCPKVRKTGQVILLSPHQIVDQACLMIVQSASFLKQKQWPELKGNSSEK